MSYDIYTSTNINLFKYFYPIIDTKYDYGSYHIMTLDIEEKYFSIINTLRKIFFLFFLQNGIRIKIKNITGGKKIITRKIHICKCYW